MLVNLFLTISIIGTVQDDMSIFGYYPIEPLPKYCIEPPQNLYNEFDSIIKLGFEIGHPVVAVSYYLAVADSISLESTTDLNLLFLYEAALAMMMHHKLKSISRDQHRSAAQDPVEYLKRYHDSLPVPCGGELRAYLLYNQACATYYSAYRPNGYKKTSNLEVREVAREIFTTIVEDYPQSNVKPLAEVSLAWYLVEAHRFEEAIFVFTSIIENSELKESQVYAAYGIGLCNYYIAEIDHTLTQEQEGEHLIEGARWLFTADDYRTQLCISVRPQDATPAFEYLPLADSIIDEGLFWRARCLEEAGYYGNALEIYQSIADEYPARPKAGEAMQKIIEFYVRACEIDSAIVYTEEAGRNLARSRRIYSVPYGYGLAALFDYYMSIGEEEKAEEYAQRLVTELGSVEPIHVCPGVYEAETIEEISEYIEKIKARNPKSQFLPELLYKKAWMLILDERYEEAAVTLSEFTDWPDTNATEDFMPDAIFMLARVYVATERYQEAIIQLKIWLDRYETGEDARPDLAPIVNFNIAWAYYNIALASEDTEVQREHYEKAIYYFNHLSDMYGDTEYYANAQENIDQLLAECQARLQ